MLISFDFDSTLKTRMGNPNKEIVKEYQRHRECDDTIIIVTSRYPVSGSTREILMFLYENDLFIDNMPPKVIYTCGELKVSTLIELGVEKHFDDCPSELQALPPHIVGVNAWTEQAAKDFDQSYNN